MTGGGMDVWMGQDPETGRVFLQTREPGDEDFPRGRRGRGWPVRRGRIDPAQWEALLAGALPPDEQDELHLRLWAASENTREA